MNHNCFRHIIWGSALIVLCCISNEIKFEHWAKMFRKIDEFHLRSLALDARITTDFFQISSLHLKTKWKSTVERTRLYKTWSIFIRGKKLFQAIFNSFRQKYSEVFLHVHSRVSSTSHNFSNVKANFSISMTIRTKINSIEWSDFSW